MNITEWAEMFMVGFWLIVSIPVISAISVAIVNRLDKEPEMNPQERVRETQERRRSGAAGKHQDRRLRRTRTRTTARSRAIRESRTDV